MQAFNRKFVLVPLLTATLLGSGHWAWADPPSILSMFRKKEPIPEGALELKAEHGPWLILASTLSGDGALDQATALAQELRTELRLPTYIMQRQGDKQTLATRDRVKTDKYGNQRPYQLEIKYANGTAATTYAVLVGEFNSTDDPRIEDALNAVRTAQPKALLGEETAATADEVTPGDLVQRKRSLLWSRTDRGRAQKKGPMGAAFVARNPLLPDDFFQAPPIDKFVEELNREKFINYSLLDCPGRFTVRVASFRGKEVTDFGNGAQASKMDDTSNALDKAAVKAHKMVESLRKKGVEAYEFHDKFGSYVMIGSFDSLGQELESGQFQFNPGIQAVLDEYCGYRVIDTKDPQTGAMSKQTSLKSENRVPFDIEGKPMAVPRPESKGIYNGSLLGGR
jgi:hypothetical protein